ncbi:MAG TPA: nucleoside 2-deoxyribosyltransferase domain-containing protein [Candidatus Eisenbacteria bacterium]|jgi:hypothetical protein|nr:nucleoside 2-deoxyribosyltransferase domain-containing protein [Candidatus Eisenbacteria bacterium]
MGLILIPPARMPVERPLIFLAGPIQGAPDWQAAAIAFIAAEAPDLDVASPRRGETRGEFSEDMYMEQVDWEHDHLAIASDRGVTLFWLAKEAVPTPGRAYAQTTRFELGEAVTGHRFTGSRVVVGIEDGFTNARYLRRTIGKKAPAIPLCASLEETCRKAIELARAPR